MRGLVLKNVIKWIAIVAAALLAIVALLIFSLRLSSQKKTEAQIIEALKSHYEPVQIEIEDRVEFKRSGSDWGFGGRVCFKIRVQSGNPGQFERRISMIADGDDGGAFEFASEYPTMEQCKATFIDYDQRLLE